MRPDYSPITSLSSGECEECEEWTTHTPLSTHYSVSREVRSPRAPNAEIHDGSPRPSSPDPSQDAPEGRP